MIRMLVAGVGAVLLLVAGVVLWRGTGQAREPVSAAPSAAVTAGSPGTEEGGDDRALPPQASARTREERRFARYDRDRNGAVGRDEYLLSRRKAYAKLDTNGDGALSFEEYAVKTSTKFYQADGDHSGVLTPVEFSTTRVVRKAPRYAANCPPQREAQADD